MKLNIGGGSDSWGDVRLDITREYWLIKGKSSVNFIGDTQFLPFKDKCFDEVRMHHVLEHVSDWKKALNECCRVAKKLSIRVPENSSIPKAECFILLATPFITLFRPHKRKRISLLLKLPKRAKEHIWQFDVKTLKLMLHKEGFRNIHVESGGRWLNGLISYGHRAKYFGFPIDWEITAEHKG